MELGCNKVIQGFTIPGGWTVGPLSPLLDTYTPSPLLLWSPASNVPDAPTTVSLRADECPGTPQGRKERALSAFAKKNAVDLPDSQIYFDCRSDSTANVYHILMNQIGDALFGLDALGIPERWKDLVFIVPETIPGYSRGLFRCLGFNVLAAGLSSIRGNRLLVAPVSDPLRLGAPFFLRRHALQIGLLDPRDTAEDQIFLNRRGRRSLSNLERVEPVLMRNGYRTVYMEDLLPEDQIRTAAGSSAAFALHGAAMAYLMFRDPSRPSLTVEAFPSTYAINSFRAIASRTGARWIGCLGCFDYQAMSRVAEGCHPRIHEGDAYQLDLAAVEGAIRLSAAPASLFAGFADPSLLAFKKREEA